jgi:hypothetical protein
MGDNRTHWSIVASNSHRIPHSQKYFMLINHGAVRILSFEFEAVGWARFSCPRVTHQPKAGPKPNNIFNDEP